MTEAGADMFTFHVCVVVGGSNAEAGTDMFTFHVCVVVGGSNV